MISPVILPGFFDSAIWPLYGEFSDDFVSGG